MWLRMGVGRMRIDGQPRDMITTVLDGLTQLTADDCEVVYSRGANVIDLVPDPAGEFYPDGQPRPKIGVSAAVDQALIDEAVANARQSDLIVAVVGDVVQLVGETCSTATLELLGGQNALLDAFAAVSEETGKSMVTVLISSKPQVLPASRNYVAAFGWFGLRAVSGPRPYDGSAGGPGLVRDCWMRREVSWFLSSTCTTRFARLPLMPALARSCCSVLEQRV